MAAPTLALVTCVHDEEAALPAFLAYHRALGVERAYVYLDRCRDRSIVAVEEADFAVPIRADRSPATRFLLEYQNACALDALGRARDEGIDWLLHVDVDEFAWGQSPDALSASGGSGASVLDEGDLRGMVGRAAEDTDVVVLDILEALAELGASDVTDLHHFQSPDQPIPRRLLDPRSGRRLVVRRLLGHDLGKSAVRTTADLTPVTAHHWRSSSGGEPRQEHLGTLFHFPAITAKQWRAKYAKLAFEPGRWPEGEPVPFPKQAWKQTTPRMTEGEAAEYFTRWVAMAPTEVHSLVERGQVRELRHVAEVLAAEGRAR